MRRAVSACAAWVRVSASWLALYCSTTISIWSFMWSMSAWTLVASARSRAILAAGEAGPALAWAGCARLITAVWPPCDLPRCNHAGEARAPDQRRLAFGSRLAKECRRQPSCNPTWKLAIPAQYRSAGGTVASGDQDLGALHLEAGTPHTAFTIGPFEPFSSPSEWNQPPLWYSSVTPSARRQQCLLWPSAIVVPPSPVCGNKLTIMRPAVAELTSARQPVQVAREGPRTWGLDGYVAPRAARNWSSITFSPALTCSAPNPMKPPSFAASAAACAVATSHPWNASTSCGVALAVTIWLTPRSSSSTCWPLVGL